MYVEGGGSRAGIVWTVAGVAGSGGLSRGTTLNEHLAILYIWWWQASRESAPGADPELTHAQESCQRASVSSRFRRTFMPFTSNPLVLVFMELVTVRAIPYLPLKFLFIVWFLKCFCKKKHFYYGFCVRSFIASLFLHNVYLLSTFFLDLSSIIFFFSTF